MLNLFKLLSFTILLACLNFGCQDSSHKSGRWQPVRQADWKTRFHDVFFFDKKNGWAVGNNEGSSLEEEISSVIVATQDGGKSWHPQESRTPYALKKVQFTTVNSGWIVGDNGLVLFTNDSGYNWQSHSIDTFNNLYDVYFINPQTGWIVGDYGLARYTNNGGETWKSTNEKFREHALRGVFFLDSQTGWIVTYEGYIYQTLDGGQNWTRKRPVGYELTSVYFIDRQNGWITGNKRTILRSQDGGESWKYITEGSNERHETSYGQRLKTGDEPLHSFILFEMSFVSDQTGWIVGDLGVILKTEDGGNTWQHLRGGHRQIPGGDVVLQGVHFVDNQEGWAVGEFGTILHT